MQLHRMMAAPKTPTQYTLEAYFRTPPANLRPSSKQMAWLWVREPDRLTHEEVAVVEHLQQDAEIARVYDLAQQFVHMVSACSGVLVERLEADQVVIQLDLHDKLPLDALKARGVPAAQIRLVYQNHVPVVS